MKIKNRIVNAALLLPVCVLLVVLAYYAWNITFYEFSEDATEYTVTTEASGTEGHSIFFDYDNKEIGLRYDSDIQVSEFSFYGYTDMGIAVMTEDNMQTLTEEYTGSFLVTASAHYIASEETGARIRVYPAAKTDMEFSQLESTDGVLFGQEVYPVEVTFNNRKTVQVYYLDEPLANAEITVTYSDGGSVLMSTDQDGYLGQITAADARKGFSIYYSASEIDAYLLHYRVQRASMFSAEYFAAMLPLLIIILLSAAVIALCVILRRLLLKKASNPDGIIGRRGGAHLGGAPKLPVSKFMVLRWACMIVCFVVVVYGAQLFGIWFNSISIPFLACEVNDDQFVMGSCYYLANLDLLMDSSWQDIALFFGTFLASIVLLGRVMCGFLCPMGLIQDAVHAVRQALKIEGLSFTDKMYIAMTPIKWTMVIMMLGLCFVGGKFCDFCPAKALSPALAGFQTSLYTSGFIMVIAIVGSFFKRRFWCMVCPLGFLMGLLNRLSIFRLKKDCQACTSCGACYEACPMGIKNVYTEREKQDVTAADCIMCGECVRRCPENNALFIAFCGKRIYSSSRKNVLCVPQRKLAEKTKTQ